ncbi:membrane alanyl aminopeptidase-like [Vanessa tameamea]|uniref:Aminopeptidase n=1 Tax=Vanessa tameamea TaxID=334116 RepID=A0ABM4AJA9_VANTA
MMTFFRKLALLPVLLTLVKSDFPLDIEEPILRNNAGDEIYRLPEDLDPIHIKVEMTPYFEAEDNKEAFTFDGLVELTVQAVKDNVSSLVIHENVREILALTVTNTAGVPLALDLLRPFERIREHHFLKINLGEGITLVNSEIYKLSIQYIGNINETPLSRGVFRGSYKGSDGKIHWYAASHLQPTNSRQFFPCFDEPGFKSTFDIIVNRPENFTQTYSNMAIKEEISIGNRRKEIFYTTPRMSAYLVTVHISEEFTVIADNNNAAASYRILARPNAQGQGEYALQVGPPITRWLEEYFDIPYYTMAENMKNDQIASPDWASGATENWGLVSYRELRLLYEEGETNALDKMTIGTITAHELAHKWFGNLITCRWWDNVWINEGFASYFEYFAMDGVDPAMELEDQFNIRYLQSALSSDASASTRALKHTVNSPAQVTGHFSGISYTKGASFLLMLKHFLGESTFKKALNYFLVERAYQHAFPSDLFSSFEKAVEVDNVLSENLNISQIMRYWVEEPGYPVLNVNVDMANGNITLTQERFFISPSATQTQQVWPLPLTFTTGNNPDWNNLTPSHVMLGRTMEIQKDPGHEWVIFNVQQKGIYRVNYDTHTWEMIADALKNKDSNIHHLNKAQIVDDVFALMRSERMSYDLGFKVLDFLKEETNYYSWFPAISGFSWLRNRFLHLPDTLRQFDEILYDFLDAVIKDLGYDVEVGEPLTRTLNRFTVLSFACDIGHEGCVNNAITKFNALVADGISVNPNLRRHVFCQGLLNGGLEAWRFLYQRRLNSNNQADEAAMLRSLGCTTNEQAIQEYLQMILSDDLKAQDSVNAFTFLLMGNRGNAKIVLQFVKDNVESIVKKVVLPTWFANVLSNLAAYMDEDGLNDMEQWLRANQASVPSAQTGLSAIVSARANMRWGSDRAQTVLRAARGSATVAVPATVLLLTTSIALMLR